MATEKRLIDANEIEGLFYKQVEWGATDLMDAFDDALNDAQTVDAVEVVRCGKCKWYDPDSEYCQFWHGVRHPGHYCGEGDGDGNG